MPHHNQGPDGRNKRQKTSPETDGHVPNHAPLDAENGETTSKEKNGSSAFKPRAYQLEMLDTSLKGNTIVAMDTGSGKTQIAILRIRAELERCPERKLVWFMAPTVVLATQQHAAISKQLSAYQTRLLLGSDNVNYWSTQKVWDDMLLNIRVVISTPQVLLDAMTHGFVTMPQIALLVFDEAHHCAASAPANTIMQDFYHSRLHSLGTTDGLPHILGLTASPDKLEKLEANLHARCVAPKIHREELMQYVHLPEHGTITFQNDMSEPTPMLRSLIEAFQEVDIEEDPCIRRLRKKNDLKSIEKLRKYLEKRNTPCLSQLSKFLNRSISMHQDLGPWAADAFISEVVKRVKAKVSRHSVEVLTSWDKEDDMFILETLSKIQIPQEIDCWDSEPEPVAEKVALLVDLLEKEYTPDFTGIIFVQQRATVKMLSHLIVKHPRLRNIFAGAFVGDSGYDGRKSEIIELHDARDQKTAVADLKSGKKNLLIATSVLEEGIDVSACHLVVCFDPVSNLRSFIQRRGRARRDRSKFVMFLDASDSCRLGKWSKMEAEMKEMYEDDKRIREAIQTKEDIEEEGGRYLRIESTGACLTFDNARSHLEHFCATLACDFTDSRPEFILSEDPVTETTTAKVILPGVLDPEFRVTHAISLWRTEKMAQRDAAFQAYSKLYQGELVNDHLLPSHCQLDDNPALAHIEKRPSVTTVSQCFDPWLMVASQWQGAKSFFQTSIEITSSSRTFPRMLLVLPIPVPRAISFKVFWDEETTFTVELKPETASFPADLIKSATDATYTVLSSVYSHRMQSDRSDFSYLFLPEAKQTAEDIGNWCCSVNGVVPAKDVAESNCEAFTHLGLVRAFDKGYSCRPCTLECFKMKAISEDNPEVVLHVEGIAWPKRADFLHPVANSDGLHLHHTARKCYQARNCTVDKLPLDYAKFALLAPSIIHNVEVFLVADQLNKTILAPAAFDDLSLLVTALSSSVAREATNYQRIEFLGDSLLKLHASLQLSAINRHWHEGLLSIAKDRIVSNKTLCNAAVKMGIDKFILVKPFTGAKWRPSYNSARLEKGNEVQPEREMSTKVLADVIEALLGAAAIDGGEEKVEKCLETLLPEVPWIPYKDRVSRLYDMAPEDKADTPTELLQDAEGLLGYMFNKNILLVQALTHPSNPGTTMSYQRLEFVGDSILDHIIVNHLFYCPREFAHFDMHLMRTALANADFLAFLCMGMSTDVERGEILKSTKEGTSTGMTVQKVSLWQFMRHGASWEITNAQGDTLAQYAALKDDISKALDESDTYPWTLLSQLRAEKFFSDLIESVLGAIYIDSHGSLGACTTFLERLGLMKCLRRMLDGDIDFMHPKQRLGQVAEREKVRYEAECVRGEEGESPYWKCKVFVGEAKTPIVEVDGGVSRMEAETRAAEAAVAVLRKKQSVDFGCDTPMSDV
ncbi:Dicer-like protein 2 [Onygenales sp. PD_10]|nr:Dicer-like protein 2 [Onygenales sp. PD_10]